MKVDYYDKAHVIFSILFSWNPLKLKNQDIASQVKTSHTDMRIRIFASPQKHIYHMH